MVRVLGVEQLESSAYLGMITKLAWKTWQQLPIHTRTWISIEDMVLDGLQWVELAGLQRWDKKRGGLTTILYVGVEHYFYDHYLQRFAMTQKTREQKVVSIQAQELASREQGNEFEFERVFGLKTPTQKEIEQQYLNCLAADHLSALYQEASLRTKQSIQAWFLRHAMWQEKDVKWYTKNVSFKRAAKEFRFMAGVRGVTIDECRHLLSSPLCLERLSRNVIGLPYSWEAPVCR